MTETDVYRADGPLPQGRAAIEASAGTGKTHALAELVRRYVAEEAVPIDKLLLVSFTRAAAGELRGRVRDGLVGAIAELRGSAAEPATLLELLETAKRDEQLSALERALSDFDSATITTIHGFAQQVLATLGSRATGDPDAVLLEDTAELAETVCADVLADEAFRNPASAGALPRLDQLTEVVGKVLGNPGIALVPELSVAGLIPAAARLRQLVDAAVEGVRLARRAAGTMSFDDLLTQLRDAISRSPSAAAGLRRRFRVALVDEFQDTDPVQWEIFSTLFGRPGEDSTMVVVADPKQAIYAFRGASVHTYLEAAYQPGTARSTLTENWRSDGALLKALERLFTGATFGDPRIGFVRVAPCGQHAELRPRTAEGRALPALVLRLAVGDHLARTRSDQVRVPAALREVARDLAEQVQELLETARLPDGGESRALRPGDIAVLITRNADAEAFQEALAGRGVPAVTTRSDSVMGSAAAQQWRWLLAALARPTDPRRARTAALSWFFGWSLPELDERAEDDLGRLQDTLISWNETLGSHGVGELCARIFAESGVTARVLATPSGDRALTDLDHIAGLLKANAPRRLGSAAGLLKVLDELSARVTEDPEEDPTSRRIESEADAVQIMTIHGAKGLQFPVVCVPTLWRLGGERDLVVYRDPETGRRTIDVAFRAQWPDAGAAQERKRLADAEEAGEGMRRMYVALTRAEHMTLVWWSAVSNADKTALAHVLFARTGSDIDPGLFAEEKVALPQDDKTAAFLEPVFAPLGDMASLGETAPPGPETRRWSGGSAAAPPASLGVARLERDLPRSARRWSFSTIAQRAAPGEAGEEARDEAAGDDEATGVPPEEGGSPPPPTGASSDLPLGLIPGGTGFGTLVHEVLEALEFDGPEVLDQLSGLIEERLRYNPWPVEVAELAAGLELAVDTPLGEMFGGRRLRDIARQDRLGELGFELRLGGRGRVASDRDIGRLLARSLPEGDQFAAWARSLAEGLFHVDLAGHLTGSIDMVVRVRGEAPDRDRFVVVDYKTNVLGEPGRPPRLSDYTPTAMAAAMVAHHYPLQALLYSVALHRYLRWRLRPYDPGRHLGGVSYLFLRGMAGPEAPAGGVFNWAVPPALVGALSDLLDGAEPAP